MSRFNPESPYATEVVPSPNHGERRGPLDMLLLHYTGMRDGDVALARLCEAESQVSAHYVVFEDGRIVQCVPEARRAWHAGESRWAGERDINSRSIGIEIVNPGHEFGYRDFPARQTTAVVALCRDIAARRLISRERVLGHSDVAPARKIDPGEKFPWDKLYKGGVGLWVAPSPLAKGPVYRTGDHGRAVADIQSGLARYGYAVEPTGHYDETTAQIVAAFQRHFRPLRVDGAADVSTRETLRHLLTKLAEQA